MTATDAAWIDVCGADDIERGDLVRFDHGGRTYVVLRTADDRYFATDGECTHARVHLSKGFLDGVVLECAKHNGRFDITTGAALGAPAIVDLGCHPVRVLDGAVQLAIG